MMKKQSQITKEKNKTREERTNTDDLEAEESKNERSQQPGKCVDFAASKKPAASSRGRQNSMDIKRC